MRDAGAAQVAVGREIEPARGRKTANGENNKVRPEDRPVHDWYRFVLSFPPHLVRSYALRLGLDSRHRVLDPFCGTGTTVVECKRLGIPGVGIEANPMAHFASAVKVDWSPDPEGLLAHSRAVADLALARLRTDGIEDSALLYGWQREHHPRCTLRTLEPEATDLLLAGSISPLPLHKTLVLLDTLEQHRDERYHRHQRLALARALVWSISNLQFGPEVGVGPARPDVEVVSTWLVAVRAMADDLRALQGGASAPAEVHFGDSRQALKLLEPHSIDAVITSPPYPNEKDYTRTTRLESVLLGFIRDRAGLKALKRGLVRSNTRGVYRDDDDDRWVAGNPEIGRIADAIEARRLELGKTSGFERMYARVTRLYFGGMARHLADLRPILRPGARLAYVVGDQGSYLQVMIRTGELLGGIARDLGYEVTGIDLFRTRLATATREQLREEVLLLRWRG